jgi:predicted secreted Zn-dependent protease
MEWHSKAHEILKGQAIAWPFFVSASALHFLASLRREVCRSMLASHCPPELRLKITPLHQPIKYALMISTLLMGALPAIALAQDFKHTQQIKTYAISGTTPMELYQSIGNRGPEVGVQAIAYTTFKLTWRRDYQPQKDGSCILVSAKPNLNLIYMLPKPSRALPGDVASGWKRFLSGIETHEHEHGRHVIEMVQAIKDYSTGLRAENDPKCQRVRDVLQKRLGELSKDQRARGADFDRAEMSPGGNVHQLILSFLNGS